MERGHHSDPEPTTPEERPAEAVVPEADAASDPALKQRLDLGKIAHFTSEIRTLAINAAVLILIIVLVPVIVRQFFRDEVLIEPISVPEALANTGLTPEVAANRLWDGLKQVKDQAGSAKQSLAAVPDSKQIDFSIPDSGISIDSLIYYVRQFFNAYETRISGEFRCATPECDPAGVTLRIRVMRQGLDVIQLPPMAKDTEGEYFEAAASEVLTLLDPFTALAAQAQSDPLKATVLARKLVRAGHPDSKWALNLIGNIKLDQNDIDAAITEYNQALKLDPQFVQARTNLGNALRLKGDVKGARAAYAIAQRESPKDVFVLSGLADLDILDGKPDQAIGLLLEASNRAPDNPSFLTKAGNIEFGRGNKDKAEAYWRQALDIAPDDALPLLMLSQMLLTDGREGEVEPLYHNAADIAPNDPEYQAQDAEYLRVANKLDEALARADKAIALAPDVADYHVTRGWVFKSMKRLEDALGEFNTALQLDPKDSGTVYDTATILQALGRNDEAFAAYKRYLELDPSGPLAPAAKIWMAKLTVPDVQPPDAAAPQAAVTNGPATGG